MISIAQAREWSRRASTRGPAAPGSTRDADGVSRVVVMGAGESGIQTINAMLGDPSSPYDPVAVVDDDPAKSDTSVRGIPVRGTFRDLVEVAEVSGSSTVVLAVPSAAAALIRSVTDTATMAGLSIRIVPPVQNLIGGTIGITDIGPVTESDLLGRRNIDTDVNAMAAYLEGKRVLVTGAGGSIGSELCRQIYRFKPASLVKVDRDEVALQALQLSIEGLGHLETRNLVVADVRDGTRIDEVFAEHKPEIVFHAAALRHLSLLELYPEEAWKTNVEGTNHVLRAAAKVGVTHFVNVSTDKAADPNSVLGYTKRIAEQLTVWYAHRSRGDWVSVRFGNVLGSRGSVLETFYAQIDAGGPVTVPHPEATRFFMSPSDACQLVIQAAAIGHRGEAMVLDMGEPVRLVDVAERLVAAVEEPISIIFTGLRPGEKLHDTLVSGGELEIRRAHPLITHLHVPALTPAQLGLLDRTSAEIAKASMAQMCSESATSITGSLLPG